MEDVIFEGYFFLIGAIGLMNILFIDNSQKQNIFLADMMPLLFSGSSPGFCTLDNWEEPFEVNELELVIYLSKNMDNSLTDIATRCKEKKIPFLCVLDNYTYEEFQFLLQEQIQGLIQRTSTSLKEIKEIMDLIMKGGFYLKPPAKREFEMNTH